MDILVVYASATGRTKRMAEALAEGAGGDGADVAMRRCEEAEPSDLQAARAIVLGSGVHMGGIESSMRVFMESAAPLWMAGALHGRLGGAFASAGAGGRGGGELALISLWANLAEHGCLMVPMHNRLEGFAAGGCHWGPLSWTNPREGKAGPTEAHLNACRSYGGHVSDCLARWTQSPPGRPSP